MVNMNTMDVVMEDPLSKAKEEAMKLGHDRMKLEDELKEWLSILAKNGVGMDEALIDAEGYPRSDIDVYQVRHARHRIICVRNDLKILMTKIEEQLSIIHSLSDGSSSSPTRQANDVFDVPIARVASVSSGSPADEAGLKMGDSILSFGSVRSENFTGIEAIANVVQHSLNQLVKVMVDRDEKILKLYLKPHKWSGPGVLGCHIIPYEHVER